MAALSARNFRQVAALSFREAPLYHEAIVASDVQDALALARYIESFAEASFKWQLPAEKSAGYEKLCGEPSCCIVTASGTLPHAAIHLTVPREGANSLTVVNIIPLSAPCLGVAQYNSVLVSFTRAISRYMRNSFDPHSFQMLFTEEPGWSAEDASLCRSRVEVGLDVLATDRGFNRR